MPLIPALRGRGGWVSASSRPATLCNKSLVLEEAEGTEKKEDVVKYGWRVCADPLEWGEGGGSGALEYDRDFLIR